MRLGGLISTIGTTGLGWQCSPHGLETDKSPALCSKLVFTTVQDIFLVIDSTLIYPYYSQPRLLNQAQSHRQAIRDKIKPVIAIQV
jgi:hypothetical protein